MRSGLCQSIKELVDVITGEKTVLVFAYYGYNTEKMIINIITKTRMRKLELFSYSLTQTIIKK